MSIFISIHLTEEVLGLFGGDIDPVGGKEVDEIIKCDFAFALLVDSLEGGVGFEGGLFGQDLPDHFGSLFSLSDVLDEGAQPLLRGV